MKKTIKATVHRVDGWWSVAFTLDGREMGTQARRFNQVADMVKDAATLMAGGKAEDYTVEIQFADKEYARLLEKCLSTSTEAKKAAQKAATESRSTIVTLREKGLTVREISSMLDISPQRVSQLATSK